MTLKSDYNAANYLLSIVPATVKPKCFLAAYVLTSADVSALCEAAEADARRYVYNGCASFLAGLRSFYAQGGVWTVTQMYYTAFYLARGHLCRLRTLVFHVPRESKSGHAQFRLDAAAGNKPTVTDTPSTHKLVAELFRKAGYPAFMRGLEIAGEDPFHWITQQREHWQYRCGRFPDPDLPDSLASHDPKRMSRLIETYLHDQTGAYLADESHALLSLPLRLLEWSLKAAPLLAPGVVDVDDVRHLRQQCQIGKHRLTSVERLLPV